MRKRFFDTEAWKWIRLAIEIALIGAAIMVLIWIYTSMGFAVADSLWEEMYVICTPGDCVNVRISPSRKSEAVGRLEAGDGVWTDGKKRNGFLHVVDLRMEVNEGWIHTGYIVENRPVRIDRTATVISKGRLKARKYVNGRRTKWLKSGATLKVYYWSDSWCVTNCGYVKSKYLELEGGNPDGVQSILHDVQAMR